MSEGLRSRAKEVYEDVEEAENVEELRERLEHMRSMVNQRPHRKSGIDDGFLSVVFGGILLIITFVAIYAFYHLFTAVYRRWYPPEL